MVPETAIVSPHRPSTAMVGMTVMVSPHRLDTDMVSVAVMASPHRSDTAMVNVAVMASPHRSDTAMVGVTAMVSPHRLDTAMTGETAIVDMAAMVSPHRPGTVMVDVTAIVDVAAMVSEKLSITGVSTHCKGKCYVLMFRKCVLTLSTISSFRSRVILKQERRKQKEFFEKKKLKSKMKRLGVSSPKSSAVSLDLLNLYVVNQISTKDDNTENIRKPVHIDIIEDVKVPVRRHNIELPTSPIRPQPMSNLDDIQNRLQQQVLDSRRQHLSEKVKYQHNSSQVTGLMYADSHMEHEENIAGAFSDCPLSSSAFWSSNSTQLSEENFNTNLMGSTWEQTYGDKLQNRPGNSSDQDSWITNPPSQCIFRKSDTMPRELFKPLHRLDYMNPARKNPVIMTLNDSENCEGLKEPLFDVVKETIELKTPQDGSDCSFLALFEDESQPIHINPSPEHCHSFVNQSSTAIFYIDPDDRNQMTNRNVPYDTTEAYPASSKVKSSVDRHLEGIFTAPEQVLVESNTTSSARYKKTSGLHKNHLQDCCEGRHYFIPFGRKEKPANLEKVETFAYHQQINLKENMQNYSRKKCKKESVKEPAWTKNQLFAFEQFSTAQEEECKSGGSSNLHKMEKDVESSLSSQSPSYSPRQTESCFSSSPDTSEEEETARTNHLNEQSLKTDDANLVSASASTEPLRTSHTRTFPLHPGSSLPREAANRPQEKDSILRATKGENKSLHALAEGSLFPPALRSELGARRTRRDGWSQTECSVPEVRRVDVGTQCGSGLVCSCRRARPGAHSPAARSPAVCSPAARSPTARSPTARSSASRSPTARSPTARSSASRSPTARSPTARSSASRSPTTRSPTARCPTARSSASRSPTTRSPTARCPTARPPHATPAGHEAAVAAEAEYLSLVGRRTLEVLSYIDIMREREKP
ncbi:uncharacterized protein C12orf40 homolog [Colius striatus]|uniref:uncharacterized protein C12orf40 homolog n=1 Tax=Colius striatus TaxID=57412 RepID=UPI002B1E1C0E|nr:uncharacterized protein C12orf40 homolog [Colius striatus]